MTDRQHSQADQMEQPTSDTGPDDDVHGFGGGVGINPSAGLHIMQSFGGTAGVNPSFIVQPFGGRGGKGGGRGGHV